MDTQKTIQLSLEAIAAALDVGDELGDDMPDDVYEDLEHARDACMCWLRSNPSNTAPSPTVLGTASNKSALSNPHGNSA
jgi:hypothetical protein